MSTGLGNIGAAVFYIGDLSLVPLHEKNLNRMVYPLTKSWL